MLQFDLMTYVIDCNSGEAIQLKDAELAYWPQFLQADESQLLEQLMATTDWQTETIKIAGIERLSPRLTAWYGDPDAHYRYSGILHRPNPWTKQLASLKQKVEMHTGERFNSALCNLYRNGQDSVAWHSDSEPELYGENGQEPIIASLSMGATRKFQLKHKTRKDLRHHLSLTSGSLLLMKGTTQTHWLHQIPKERGIDKARINITFRKIYPNKLGRDRRGIKVTFLACRVEQQESNKELPKHQLVQMAKETLNAGDVLVKVSYSSINYKDALAATGRAPILKRFPLNVGIDFAGEVESSEHPNFKVGDKVLANGCGIGEEFDGGLAQYVRTKSEFLIKLPQHYDARQAMIIGTAGFTAALAIYRMQQNGQTADKGPIIVTGASGGVGSVAINLLSKLGYQTIALSSRPMLKDYLLSLGADKVCTLDELNLSEKPLASTQFGGAIDNIGGKTLSQIIAHTNLWGNVASIGLAQSPKLEAMVFPFILRGVSLLGISSTNCPMELRTKIWHSFGDALPLPDFETLVSKEIALSEVSPCFDELLDKNCHGRMIVNCQ